ncbi:MAG: hypothetical protein ACOX2L_10640 [Anaerolineae bacterium]|jgi:hypothetical protein|nr:hypothetical protein [Chloroflexota bacterium]
MKTTFEFGNDPAKIARYRAFWAREEVDRPLVGFSFKSWFPLQEFAASAAWQDEDVLTPDMVVPAAFLDDQERLLREGELIQDDIMRGACPSQAVPWLDGMLGATLRILPGSILGEDRCLPWDTLSAMTLDLEGAWASVYLGFIDALVERSAGRYPISHGTLHGPSDMTAALRGHSQSVLDLLHEPVRSTRLLEQMAQMFRDVTLAAWERIPLWHGGCYDAQYQLWAPGPIIRMQEDASGLYSPALYRRFLQPVDAWLAGQFACAFMHLHSTSMFLLDEFLAIDALRCFEVNYELVSGGPPVAGMLPYWRRIQQAGRSLLIRGSFTPEEAQELVEGLDPRGLYLYIMVEDQAEIARVRPRLGLPPGQEAG